MNTAIVKDTKVLKERSREERIYQKLKIIKDYKEHKKSSTELKEIIDMVVDGISLIVSSKDK